jgi:hypothetical protein
LRSAHTSVRNAEVLNNSIATVRVNLEVINRAHGGKASEPLRLSSAGGKRHKARLLSVP